MKKKERKKEMKYTVKIENENGIVAEIADCTEKEAIREAEKEAARENNKDNQIFVSFFRPEDGQRGYLNRDGHAVTGKAW